MRDDINLKNNRNPFAMPDRIIRRRTVAELLARSPKTIDRMAKEGILHKVVLPSHIRSLGYRLSDIVALIEGKNDAETL